MPKQKKIKNKAKVKKISKKMQKCIKNKSCKIDEVKINLIIAKKMAENLDVPNIKEL